MSTRRSIARVPIRAALVLAVLVAAGRAGAETAARIRREVAEVGVEERLGASVPLDGAFTGDDGRPLALGALAGRPILLSFNYTSCPRLCGLQLGGLARTLREIHWDGGRFSVATVSIDPEEKLPQLRRYKEPFVREAGGGEGVARNWRFLAGGKPEIDALARAVGFRYRYDARTAEFAHQATLVVLTADGRVSGYLHGISYPPAALRAALDRAEAGRVASASEQASLGGFLLACMGLDPSDPAPLALRIMRAGGTAAILFLLAFLGVHALRDFRLRRSRARRDAPAAR